MTFNSTGTADKTEEGAEMVQPPERGGQRSSHTRALGRTGPTRSATAGAEREKGLVPKISFGLVFGSTLSFTRAMPITQKVHSKKKSNFYWLLKNVPVWNCIRVL